MCNFIITRGIRIHYILSASASQCSVIWWLSAVGTFGRPPRWTWPAWLGILEVFFWLGQGGMESCDLRPVYTTAPLFTGSFPWTVQQTLLLYYHQETKPGFLVKWGQLRLQQTQWSLGQSLVGGRCETAVLQMAELPLNQWPAYKKFQEHVSPGTDLDRNAFLILYNACYFTLNGLLSNQNTSYSTSHSL